MIRQRIIPNCARRSPDRGASYSGGSWTRPSPNTADALIDQLRAWRARAGITRGQWMSADPENYWDRVCLGLADIHQLPDDWWSQMLASDHPGHAQMDWGNRGGDATAYNTAAVVDWINDGKWSAG